MTGVDDDQACDCCGEFEDTAGPLEGVLCNDGSTLWLCGWCLDADDD